MTDLSKEELLRRLLRIEDEVLPGAPTSSDLPEPKIGSLHDIHGKKVYDPSLGYVPKAAVDPKAGRPYTYTQDAEPSNPEEGENWYDTGADEAYVWNGSKWVQQTVVDYGQLSNAPSPGNNITEDANNNWNVSVPDPKPSNRLVSADGNAIDGAFIPSTVASVTVIPGPGPGYPTTASGSLWQCDDVTDTIYKTDQTGSVVAKFASPSGGPSGLGVDESTGSLWLSDVNNSIYELDQTGSIVGQFASQGATPRGIEVDERTGSLWHTDSASASIYELDQSGSVVTSLASPDDSPIGMDIDEKTGSLWHGGANGDSIYKMDQTGSIVTQFASPSSSPHAVTVDERTGSLYNADYSAGSVYKLDQTGSVVTKLTTPGGAPTGFDIVDHESGWTSDVYFRQAEEIERGWATGSAWGGTDYGAPSGSLWYAENWGSIYKLDQTGSVVTSFAAPSNDTTGVDINESTGSVWSADETQGSIYKTDQTGSVVTQFLAPAGSPQGIDVDERTGSLWHGDVSSSTIYKMDQTGSVITQFPHPGRYFRDVDIDETTDSLWVTGNSDNSVWKLDQTGSVVTRLAAPSNSGMGIDVDERTGSLWYSDNHDSIYKIDQTGSVVTQFMSQSSTPRGIDIADHKASTVTIQSTVGQGVGPSTAVNFTSAEDEARLTSWPHENRSFTVEWN